MKRARVQGFGQPPVAGLETASKASRPSVSRRRRDMSEPLGRGRSTHFRTTGNPRPRVRAKVFIMADSRRRRSLPCGYVQPVDWHANHADSLGYANVTNLDKLGLPPPPNSYDKSGYL